MMMLVCNVKIARRHRFYVKVFVYLPKFYALYVTIVLLWIRSFVEGDAGYQYSHVLADTVEVGPTHPLGSSENPLALVEAIDYRRQRPLNSFPYLETVKRNFVAFSLRLCRRISCYWD